MEAVGNSLRIRFRARAGGKQICFHPGIRDTGDGREKAALIAKRIELDLLAGNFDPSLEKYKLGAVISTPPENRTVENLFKDFIDWKAEQIHFHTLAKYRALLTHIKRSGLGKRVAIALTQQDIKHFCDYLKKACEPRTVKERIVLLAAAWTWAELPNNHWKIAVKSIRVPPKQPPKPFTRQEIEAILSAFSKDYPHYLPYVQFLFGTGCRTGEAIGLQWKHISDDCSSVWIGESLVKGVRKSTKTGKSRTIPINGKVRQLLLDMQRGDAEPTRRRLVEDLVFTSVGGKPIDIDNLCERCWKPALKKANVEYRRPYNCRHTFVSHALQSGLSPVQVAAITGHSTEVLFSHYAGVIEKPELPELF